MLSTLATCLSIDVYGPVCDNAGGIAEMCELHPSVREKTDALDAAGNTTAAIGKGFAIGSACLVGLALFGAFVTRLNDAQGGHMAVDLLDPAQTRLLQLPPAVRVQFREALKDLLEVRDSRHLRGVGLVEESGIDLVEHHADLVRLRHRRKDPSQR